MKKVINLDTGEILWFDASTGYEAMTKMLYYLGIGNSISNITIDKTISGNHLYFGYNDETWCVGNT